MSAVAAAVGSVAVVGGAVAPSTPAVAAPFVLTQKCVGGAGAALSNVNCSNAIAPPVGSVAASVLPSELTGLLKALRIDLNSQAIVLGSDGTATISGTGFALSAQALHLPFGGTGGGTSTANAVTPLSAAVAVGIGTGNASATAVSGVAVAAAGSGTSSSALSVGGVATAIDILGVKNVTCTALYAQASATDVGSCTSVLYIFTAKNTAGSDVWTFAIADPTSLQVAGPGVVPVPHFARDLIRVGVGGSGGITVGSDLIPASTGSSAARTPATTRSVALSSKAATTPAAAPVSEAVSSLGKHRRVDADVVVDDIASTSLSGVTVQPTPDAATRAQSMVPGAQPMVPGAHSTGQVVPAP